MRVAKCKFSVKLSFDCLIKIIKSKYKIMKSKYKVTMSLMFR